MTALYEISNSILEIEYDTDVSEEAYLDTVEGLEGEFEVKAINIIAYVKNLESDRVGLKNEIDRLKGRMLSIKKKKESLKKYLLQNLENINMIKVGNTLHSAKIRQNPVSTKIIDELEIDDKYFVSKKTLSKKLLKEDLKLGVIVAGAELVNTRSLVIK